MTQEMSNSNKNNVRMMMGIAAIIVLVCSQICFQVGAEEEPKSVADKIKEQCKADANNELTDAIRRAESIADPRDRSFNSSSAVEAHKLAMEKCSLPSLDKSTADKLNECKAVAFTEFDKEMERAKSIIASNPMVSNFISRGAVQVLKSAKEECSKRFPGTSP